MIAFFLTAALALAPGDDTARVEAVTNALGQAEPKLHRCWEQAGASDWQVAGSVSVRAKVGAGGRVTDVELVGKLPGGGLDGCVRDAFLGMTVGPPFAPGDSIELPLEMKGEPNVTLRRDDVPAVKVANSTATVRVLVDEKSAGKTAASLTLLDIPIGGRWVRPKAAGTAVLYMIRGRAKAPGGAFTNGDLMIFPDGSAQPLLSSVRSEILLLLVPAGGEQDFRAGVATGTAGSGPAPVIIKAASGKSGAATPDGKGEQVNLLADPAAQVAKLRVDPGLTIPDHTHAGQDEILYVVEGKGTVTVDGSKYPVEPFMAIHVPAGAKHSFTASTETTTAVMIQFLAPGKR